MLDQSADNFEHDKLSLIMNIMMNICDENPDDHENADHVECIHILF